MALHHTYVLIESFVSYLIKLHLLLCSQTFKRNAETVNISPEVQVYYIVHPASRQIQRVPR